MTTFVVSLFLPYTIDFDTSSRSDPSNSPPSFKRQASTNTVAQLSLFGGPNQPAPPTPGAPDADIFFSALGTASPSLTNVAPPAAHKLVRTDSHVPEWGQARIFNQPKSRPSTAPPSTILQYAKAQNLHASEALQRLQAAKAAGPRSSISASSPSQRASRRSSRERAQSQGTWDIVPAVQGNGVLQSVMTAAREKGVPEHISWVGSLGFPTDTIPDARKNEIEERLENEYDAMAVYVDDKDFDGHYNHYCKTILWPIFHYQIPDHPKSKAYEDHSWVYYVKINEAFAERIIRTYKRGDTIWIHDYHLLLVPQMVRKKLPDAKIGFFLHTAFPSSEVFRCLAVRKALLEGMLGANVVVFQAEEYANHFLTTCGRLLVVEATEYGVQLEDHFVNVTSVPMGIVPEMVLNAREDPEVKEWIKVLMEKYKEKRLIVARDKLDSIRGVRQKLLAYERFLKENPEWREGVVLIQVATSTSVDKDLDAQISNIVTRIDAKYSTLAHQPLIFLKQDISNAQYLALLTVADVLMVTPLRDGMNVTSHEFVICQDGKGTIDMPTKKKHGPLILSEFTGSARVFNGSEISVNPWDYAQCSRAIKTALEMTDEEKDKRYEEMLGAVLSHNGERWVKELDNRLTTSYESQQQQDVMSVPRLSVNALCEQYKKASTRLFILDYEGTLTAWEAARRTTLANPQRVVDTIINLISASDSNIVYVASGRSTNEMEHLFRAVPNVGLIAENGCFLRPFTTEFQPEGWIDLADSVSASSWKPGIVNMMQYYVERIEGTWIEERACSVYFSYADVKDGDKESAARQVGDLTNHINDSCTHYRVRAVPVDKGIVVELSDHSKMTASARLLEREKARLSGSPRLKASTDGSTSQIREANGLGAPAVNMPVGYGASAVRTSSGRMDSSRTRSFAPPTDTPDSAIGGMGFFSDKKSNSVSQDQSRPQSPGGTPRSPLTVPDFLMVAGDNREDEPVFHWANELAREGIVKNVASICVGKRHTTEARFTLTQGVTGLLTALQKLAML